MGDRGRLVTRASAVRDRRSYRTHEVKSARPPGHVDRCVWIALPPISMLVAATVTLLFAHGTSRAANVAQAAAETVGTSAHVHEASGHEASQGITLAADHDTESVTSGAPCSPDAPVRAYDVVALAVDITMNRYLDHDPKGLMYALAADVARVRDEEARNSAARSGNAEPAVTIGLQGDAIQPLTLRVNQGECLRIRLTNQLSEPASIHIHGSTLRVAGTDTPAIASEAAAMAAPGASVEYVWMVGEDEPEGTHYFHSHGDDREQTVHGLFGAVIVEPKGATFLDPRTLHEIPTGWDSIIRTENGAFREFTLYYHEVGNENYQLLDRNGELVPQVDPLTSAYRPDGRALNYRSEPFMNRLALQQQRSGTFDESVAYSSYAFGDPATPLMRSYLGDPVKQRLVHGGSEVFHVHHVHGGAIRWRRQPNTEPSNIDSGLDKHPPLVPQASELTDSQSIGPSETFDIEDACGSGGCQQSVGDFLVHCHVAEHYFAGMWTIWRVYNTLQDGASSTDQLPPLRELPDRANQVAAAVTSDKLAGTTVDWSGKSLEVGPGPQLAAWVERQLPPPGVPRGYDAAVWDWTRQGDTYLGEPDGGESWPGYNARAEGDRPPILFDPHTGKLAYPFLRPHLGGRPPFAPNHGPAPYLDPTANGAEPPSPGENGPGSACPDGTRSQQYAINAITLPISLNEKDNLVDPAGEIFVLREQEQQVRADNAMRVPLAIRANAGEDCIDVLLRSELQDSPENHGFAKVNLHIHFTQFDVQASDGVVAGFNYEQSIRPYEVEGEHLTSAAEAGARSVDVASSARFQIGEVVGVGIDQNETFEVRKIRAIDGGRLTLDTPLAHGHTSGEIVSTEFVRYRWYPDVQFGTAYFHDHVNALASWKHGLFGALISEPPGSSYHDPGTGRLLRSGPIADIHTDQPISVDVTGSFRELALFVQDNNPITHVGRSSGGSLNLRAEPLAARGGDPARVFSSQLHGDPATPILQAYVGDPVVLRTLVGGTNDVHTMHVDGHWFRAEPYSATSPPISTIHLGISERYDLVIPSAGGPQARAGDYLYYNGRSFKLAEGNWGILRVVDKQSPSLARLPDREAVPSRTGSVCPELAPVKRYQVDAINAPLPMLDGEKGILFALREDAASVLDGSRKPEPLILHVNVGDCIKIALKNATQDTVSLHTDMLAFDPQSSGGVEAGSNSPQDIPVGGEREYTYYADPRIGETTALLRDWGDVLKNPRLGAYGAIIVGPKGASYMDPLTGHDAGNEASWNVVVHPVGAPAYRDFTLMFEDEDEAIGTHRMPYTTQVSGVSGINYGRVTGGAPTLAALEAVGSDPETPLLRAFAGEPIRIHVVAPSSEQGQVFSVEGHRWSQEPNRAGTNLLSSAQIGGTDAATLDLAGGAATLPGDYLYGAHRAPYLEAGLWGVLRVERPGNAAALRPLSGSNGKVVDLSGGRISLLGMVVAAGLGASGSVYLLRRRRRA